MKAKDLIPILQSNPEAEIVVSSVSYYERSHYDAGYDRGDIQTVTEVAIKTDEGRVHLLGGTVKKI